MTDENVNTPQAEENSVTNPSTQAAEKQDVPYGRFQEKNAQWKERGDMLEKKDARIAELEAKQEEARQKALKDAGDIETLLKETQSENAKYKDQIGVYKANEEQERADMMKQVAEDDVEFTSGMNNATLRKFINKTQSNINAGKTDSSRAGTTAKGDFGGYSSHAEWATKDPKGYQKNNMTTDAQGIKLGYGD